MARSPSCRPGDSDEELDTWHRWWRSEVADEAPEQMKTGSRAGEAELLIRGEDADGLPGTPFGQPRSDGFGHLLTLARAGEVDQDAAGTEILVPRSPIAGRRCSTARRGLLEKLMFGDSIPRV